MQYMLEVLKIIEGAIRLDKAKVVNFTSHLAQKLEKDGEIRTAEKIRRLMSREDNLLLGSTSLTDHVNVPVDQESRLAMADIIRPSDLQEDIFLNSAISLSVKKFLSYQHMADRLVGQGLVVPNSLILYGPPGCGKTLLAKFIAKSLELPLVITRLDGLISSFLGSTSKNIRAIFDYAEKRPCVLFLDEFDAIAKIRDDNHELGELKRVVNSLLQNIDGLRNGTILIAATNHEHLLDAAVWRRFSHKLQITVPDFNTRTLLVRHFLRISDIDEHDVHIISLLIKGLSGADIENICNKALLDSVTIESKASLIHFVVDHFFDHINITKSLDPDSATDRASEILKAEFMRNQDRKIFSYSCIGRLLSRSKAHIANILKQKEVVYDEEFEISSPACRSPQET